MRAPAGARRQAATTTSPSAAACSAASPPVRGYFRQTPTGVFAGASPAALRDNSPAEYIGGLAPEIRRLGLRTWVFQGRTDDADPRLLRAFAAQLHAAGADVHLGFFPGGHDWGSSAPRRRGC